MKQPLKLQHPPARILHRCALFAAAITLSAQAAFAGFNVPTSYATGVQPIGIATGDFNGDHKLDLVTANSNNNGEGMVSVLLGNGNGTFAAHTDIDAGPGSASSIAVADFNHDGKLDVVVGKNGTAVRVFIGHGDGTFAAAVPYVTGSQPYALAVGDFNGDGMPDIATANLNSDDVSILINNGDGTFAAAVTFAIGNAPNGIVANDFNGDGKLDLAIVRQAPAGVSVILGNGDGTFAAPLSQALTGSPRAVVAGDFNADGKFDLAIANDVSPGEVDVLLGVGDGTFGSAKSFSVGAFSRCLAANEFNGDGKVDLAVPSTSANSVNVLSGVGDGTFGAASSNSLAASTNPNGVTIGDFNGDGKPDIAVSNYGGNSVSVLLNNSASASPGISIDDVRVAETDSGTVNATFTLRLAHPSASTVTVNAATAGGTAQSGIDFDAVPSTPVSFSPGSVTQTFSVLVRGDQISEPDETFLVKLSGATNGFIEDAVGVGTITDNDPFPTVHISDTNVVEGDSGASTAIFQVGLSAPSGDTISVNFATADGTGPRAATVADGDYSATSGTVTFPPGSTSQTASVQVPGDTKPEANENFRVVLSNPVNATIAGNPGVGTIVNDDGPNILAVGYSLWNESAKTCGSGNGVIDPGETVSINLVLRNFSPGAAGNLKATLQNTGGVLAASAPQTYGALSFNDGAQARPFTFTADSSLHGGDIVTLTLALDDGTTSLAPVSIPVVLSRRVPVRENFDVPFASALPSGWVGHITGVAGDSAWRTIALQAASLPNGAFGPSEAHVTDNTLTTPIFDVHTSSAQLIFRNSYSWEDGFDGSVLEIAVGNAPFTDILAAGGSFVSGGYNRTLSSAFGNPLGGRQAWTGSTNGFVTTIVNLPPTAAGQSVQLRWHLGTDASNSLSGQVIDDVVVIDGEADNACVETNPAPILVPAAGDSGGPGHEKADQYPSTINVSGLPGVISKLRVRISDFRHHFSDDVDMLLVGPHGQKMIIWSDVGGNTSTCGATCDNGSNLGTTGINVLLDDDAPTTLFDAAQLTSGTYRPSDVDTSTDIFPAPAPAGPYALPAPSGGATFANTFNGTDPNGTWSLYVIDDSGGDSGRIEGGWSLEITAPECDLACGANITVPAAPGQCGAVVNFPTPTGNATCGTITTSPASGSFFPKGTTVVNVNSSSGSSCSFTVTVKDMQTPNVICPANVTKQAQAGHNNAVVTYSSPEATDNCPGVVVQTTPASGSTFPVGKTVVTSTATDAVGNTDTCSFNVTVTPGPTPTPTPTATPTPSPTPTPTPTATPTPTVTPTPTPTPTPSPTPLATKLANISTRLRVDTGDNVLIGGFIITGDAPKKLIARALGPSLPVPGKLANPKLEIFDSQSHLVATNDNWQTAPNKTAMINAQVAPSNAMEAAILGTIPAGGYTAIVSGVNNGTGVGSIEIYDLDPSANSQLANISARGVVKTGDNAMIGGFILVGSKPQKLIVRALGPSLPVEGNLADPTLELIDGNGNTVASNDDWKSDQAAAIQATGIAPTNKRESAIVAKLPPAAYTAVVRGAKGTTGVAVVEVYTLQ